MRESTSSYVLSGVSAFAAVVVFANGGEFADGLGLTFAALLWWVLARREDEISDLKRQLGADLYEDARRRGEALR